MKLYMYEPAEDGSPPNLATCRNVKQLCICIISNPPREFLELISIGNDFSFNNKHYEVVEKVSGIADVTPGKEPELFLRALIEEVF